MDFLPSYLPSINHPLSQLTDIFPPSKNCKNVEKVRLQQIPRKLSSSIKLSKSRTLFKYEYNLRNERTVFSFSRAFIKTLLSRSKKKSESKRVTVTVEVPPTKMTNTFDENIALNCIMFRRSASARKLEIPIILRG